MEISKRVLNIEIKECFRKSRYVLSLYIKVKYKPIGTPSEFHYYDYYEPKTPYCGVFLYCSPP